MGLGMGSSPLSRGIPTKICRLNRNVGIIPALAGNTPAVGVGVAGDQDHPRSRGEYMPGWGMQLGARGSSPLSRGIRRPFRRVRGSFGIIPALAGNTCFPTRRDSARADHPRSRGEYSLKLPIDKEPFGSSPLSRGILEWWPQRHGRGGIIPALAGNTTAEPNGSGVSQDHPRSRGEYDGGTEWEWCQSGSSPLSRGIHELCSAHAVTVRIIPALAGNTLADKGFYQLDLSDLGNPLLARLRFSKSLVPRRRRPPS